MDRTPFAGLTVLDADEGLTTDGGSFVNRNPRIIDHLLRMGAQVHRHDAHQGLDDPGATATLQINPGGYIPSDTSVWVGFTLVDSDGGETRVSPLASARTSPPLAPPGRPAAAVSYASGTMRPGRWYYAITLLDEAGETTLGQSVAIDIAPGHANATITLSGLAALMPAGTYYNVYKSNGGAFYYVGYGNANTFVDDGTLCPDCTGLPPDTNTTATDGTLVITVPSAAVLGADAFRVYAATDMVLDSPSLVAELPVATAGQPYSLDALTFQPGSPPPVNLSVGGAEKIDPDRDLIDWHWKRPVGSSAALGSGDPGDVRLAWDDMNLYAVPSGSAATGASDWFKLNLVGPVGPQGDKGDKGDKGDRGDQGVPGVGADPRTAVVATTLALASGANEQGFVNGLGKSFRIMRIDTNRPCRVRLYQSQAKRAADAARQIGYDPTGDHGLILEVVTTATMLGIGLSPEATGASMEAPTSPDIAYSITNMDAAEAPVSVTFTRQVLEQ